MNKKYAIAIAAAAVIAVILIWVSTADTNAKEEALKNTTTTIPLPIEESVPTFAENEQTMAIPDPCGTLSIESVAKYVSPSTVRGPLLQNTTEPSESCEWLPVDTKLSTPRLGVSIAASTSIFDPLEADATETVLIGAKGYIINGYQTSLGGAACGRTIVVETATSSFVVALCKTNNAIPTTTELTELANDVLNSLS